MLSARGRMLLCSQGIKKQCKNPCPVMRMEDLLNASRSNALDNLVGDMVQTMHQQQQQQVLPTTTTPGDGNPVEGVWYSIPVSLNSSQHLCSDESWNCLLQRIQARLQDAANTACKCCALRRRGCCNCTDKMCDCDCCSKEGGRGQCTCKCCDANMWHCEIIPASKIFVVRNVLKEENKWSQRLHPVNNRDHHLCWESDRNLPIMDPIYHFYMQCKPKRSCDQEAQQEKEEQRQGFPGDGIAGPDLCFMDTMYNRWAVQNPLQLRQRILERKGQELGVPLERAWTPRPDVRDAASSSRRGKEELQQPWMAKRMGEDIENSENVLGRRGTKTTRALQGLRRN